MTRETDENGRLRDWVIVWRLRPRRHGIGLEVRWWVPDGHAESVWTVDALRRYGVIPDDDRQVIRFDGGLRK